MVEGIEQYRARKRKEAALRKMKRRLATLNKYKSTLDDPRRRWKWDTPERVCDTKPAKRVDGDTYAEGIMEWLKSQQAQ